VVEAHEVRRRAVGLDPPQVGLCPLDPRDLVELLELTSSFGSVTAVAGLGAAVLPTSSAISVTADTVGMGRVFEGETAILVVLAMAAVTCLLRLGSMGQLLRGLVVDVMTGLAAIFLDARVSLMKRVIESQGKSLRLGLSVPTHMALTAGGGARRFPFDAATIVTANTQLVISLHGVVEVLRIVHALDPRRHALWSLCTKPRAQFDGFVTLETAVLAEGRSVARMIELDDGTLRRTELFRELEHDCRAIDVSCLMVVNMSMGRFVTCDDEEEPRGPETAHPHESIPR